MYLDANKLNGATDSSGAEKRRAHRKNMRNTNQPYQIHTELPKAGK